MADWLTAYYDDVDNMRLDEYVARHTDDVEVRFANNPPAHGRDEVRQNIGHFWTMINGLRHHFVNVFTQDDSTVLEANIDYERQDGVTVTVPCTTILHRREELVDSVRIYLDIAPVFAPVEAEAGAPAAQ